MHILLDVALLGPTWLLFILWLQVGWALAIALVSQRLCGNGKCQMCGRVSPGCRAVGIRS